VYTATSIKKTFIRV